MFKKILLFISIVFSVTANAQDEFITVWQPGIVSTPALIVNAPFQADANQIWFPGTGQNYTIRWEEVGFPQHSGVMENVTSSGQVLIDFGNPTREDGSNPIYRVKVSNGNGVFQKIQFATHQVMNFNLEVLLPVLQMKGSADKLLNIEQWGNIEWTSMNAAFANCQRVEMTASDAPDLSNVTDASLMFYRANSFAGNDFMQNWDTSSIENFSFMFALQHIPGLIYAPALGAFNPPNLNKWNMSSATNLSFMFGGRDIFNQDLSSWDVSHVFTTAWMFISCSNFNQPLNSWNTSSLRYMYNMFFSASAFNQPLNNWDTSKVLNMGGAFSGAQAFNQPLEMWDVSNVKKMSSMFAGATSFNQPLGNWDISSLEFAKQIFTLSGMSCENYSRTLTGWADHPNTPDNIDLGVLQPLQYAANVSPKRDLLIGKGWTFLDDIVGSCVLKTAETHLSDDLTIYPNPVTEFIYIKNLKSSNAGYKIIDASGRIYGQNILNHDKINVRDLVPGNYILQLITKEKIQSFKFIRQ